MSFGDILFASHGGLRVVTLNRPQALNAVTEVMFRTLDGWTKSWARDPQVGMVLIKAAGERAFCAGGDVRLLREFGMRQDFELVDDVYRGHYLMDRRIHFYPKPYVALIDGIVMGGGAGISVHGSHRVATEHTRFAMPETGIGLFPDVGATWFLARCPGWIGLYLGLTGQVLNGADCHYAGIATHYTPRARLGELEQELTKADPRDHASVTAILDSFHEDPGTAPIAERRALIDRCFDQPCVEDIFLALGAERGDVAEEILCILAGRSPTSLKVTYRQLAEAIRLGPELDFDWAVKREFRLSQRFVRGHDLYEGIRAALIDKDRKPRWQPATLAEVTKADVDAYFASLGDRELKV